MMEKTWRWGVRWVGWGALCLALAWQAPAATPPDPLKALKEMSELEAQIEQAQRQHFEEQRRLLEANRSLSSVAGALQQKDRLNREGESFLKDYAARTRSELAEVDRQAAANRRTAEASRSSLALTGTRLLAESGSRTSDNSALLALGLLHELHRSRAGSASRQLQELETRRAELTGKRQHVQQSAEFQTVFSQYSIQQLRERHQELARQIAEAQAVADEQSQQVRQLASRREELKGLIAKLAEQEAREVAQPTPTPASTPPPDAAGAPLNGMRPRPALPPAGESENPAVLNPNFAPPRDEGRPSFIPAPVETPAPAAAASPAKPATGSGLAEVPYESGSEPMASAMRVSEDKDQTDASGTRHLFWRARPVGVRALAAGKVLFSGSFAGYRHLLIIDHGGGWRSLIGNMIQPRVKVGDRVEAGTELGDYQAVQGSRAEPLWFEVRQGTQAMAPESWPALPAQWQGRILAQVQETASR